MNLQRCENGHFYDADSYNTCPHCSGTVPRQDVKTAGMPQPSHDIKTDIVRSGGSNSLEQPEDRTIGIVPYNLNLDPVVGWLVCIEGPPVHKGSAFPLKAGGNFVGRESDMDVAITGDKTVARKKHAVIVYEPRQRKFTIQPGDSKELCYLDGNVILAPSDLKAESKIKIGKTVLVFIPFCTPDNDFWGLNPEE